MRQRLSASRHSHRLSAATLVHGSSEGQCPLPAGADGTGGRGMGTSRWNENVGKEEESQAQGLTRIRGHNLDRRGDFP